MTRFNDALRMWLLGASLLMHVHSSETKGTTDYKRVCYSTNWSQYRPEPAKFFPHDIDPSLCTHLVYAFAKIDYKGELAPYEWNDIPYPHLYKQFTDFKKSHSGLKTLLGVGGWSHPALRFTEMVKTQRSRRLFIDHAIQYLRAHQFDGLDLDWEYPAHRGSPPGDRERFSVLVRELRDSFEREARDTNRPRLLLTAALGASYKVIDIAYQVANIASHLDFINLMAYDLHGGWNNRLGINAPLYGREVEKGTPQAKLTVDWVVRRYLELGVPKQKLVLGIPLYGRTYQLCSAKDNRPGAPACGRGHPRFYTKEVGFMAYYEAANGHFPNSPQKPFFADMSVNPFMTIPNKTDLWSRMTGTVTEQDTPVIMLGLNKDWVRGWDDDQRCPYAYSLAERTWVSYDDKDSIYYKIQYLKEMGLGGVMVWALDLDDFNQISSKEEPRYPLMRAVNEFLLTGEDDQRTALSTHNKQTLDLGNYWLLPVNVHPVVPGPLNQSHGSPVHPGFEYYSTPQYPKLELTYLDNGKQSAGLKREPKFKPNLRRKMDYDPHEKVDKANKSSVDRLKPLVGGTWSDLIRNVLNVPLRNDKLPSYVHVYPETKPKPRHELPWGESIDMKTSHRDSGHKYSHQGLKEGENKKNGHAKVKNSNDAWRMYSWRRNNMIIPTSKAAQSKIPKVSQRVNRHKTKAWLVEDSVHGIDLKPTDFSRNINGDNIKKQTSHKVDSIASNDFVDNAKSKVGTGEENQYTYDNSSAMHRYASSGKARSYPDRFWRWAGNRNKQLKHESKINKINTSNNKMDNTVATHRPSRLETIEAVKPLVIEFNTSRNKIDDTARTHQPSRLEKAETIKNDRLVMMPLEELTQTKVTNKLPPEIPASLAKIRRRKGPNNGNWIQHDDGHWKRVNPKKINKGPYRRTLIRSQVAYLNAKYSDVKSITENSGMTSTVVPKSTSLETELHSSSTKKVASRSLTSTPSSFTQTKPSVKASLELVMATQANDPMVPHTTIDVHVDTLKFKCPAAFGIFADFDMCDHFYQCVWSVSLRYRCSPGTWWSTGMQTCVWPSQSDCGKRQQK